MKRELWFSQALEDREGDPWPEAREDGTHIYSDGGLVERRGDTFYAEGYLRPWRDLDFPPENGGLPEDAMRLHPEPDLVSFALWCTGGAMTGNDVRRELEKWRERP